MKALVFHGVGDIRLEEVADPEIRESTDAIVRLTASAICGTDLHLVRGTMGEVEPGTVLGHEGVGVVEEVGDGVTNLRRGDRVVIPSTIGCGHCSYCRDGTHSQCDEANPEGPLAGTAFFGGPRAAGGFDGLQAEYARIPFANVGPVRLPESVDDDDALMLSDIFPTGWFGADMADVRPGRTVAVFGCGPVGQFAIASALLMDAGRVIAVDRLESRLEAARAQGAETVNFEESDPVEAVRELTGGIGVDRVIDAVGVEAEPASGGPAAPSEEERERHREEVAEVSVGDDRGDDGRGDDGWQPGQAPSQALDWAVDALAKAGTLSVVGVYPPTLRHFPIGRAMGKNLRIRMGNCPHRRYIPRLTSLVASGVVRPSEVVTRDEPLVDAVEAYRTFDRREDGWLKVKLRPSEEAAEPSAGEDVAESVAVR